MPKHKEENQESNAFTEPLKVNKLWCKMCDSHHSTKDHIDRYKHPNTSQDNNPGPFPVKETL